MAYTTIDDPSAYFQIATYTGNGSGQAITFNGNSDMQPDFFWGKSRSNSSGHHLQNSTTGVKPFLVSNSDAAENTDTNNTDFLSYDSDGFTLGASYQADINHSSRTYVAWCWKANGGTRTTNTESGNNPAGGYQANTTAGFSIIDYTGTGAAGTMAHGLGAVPHAIIFKTRATGNWNVYHQGIGAGKYLLLSTTDGEQTEVSRFNNTAPTSSVFTVNTAADVNGDGTNYIAYAFAPIQGYSKFGTYTGNGDADGPFIYLGFKPKYFLLKNATASSGSGGQHWQISDTERHPDNPLDLTLFAEDNAAEGGTWSIKDFLSNGVKIRGNNYAMNTDGDTYIYMAFAEHPFVSSEGVPTTAR